ncbi:ABC transporter substrate-binding protein [Aquibacillus albus]|uniref:Multiple sugar transport system substrate-binding protein n=1 Tax=Aquibacillus albus TaxID=1168171 RepID=A0ABS2N672_9BACI|nr:ABC transporter substrate-binding protein [Aquibacillus albus]MBM7573390.1 multiple sugar transport system substrate-binding protein [Aquibacillus albus]
MKKYLLLMLSVITILLIAACSGGSDEEEASGGNGGENEQSSEETGGSDDGGGDDADQEQITLRMSWWGSQSRHDMTNEIIALYEEQNPHIKIQTEFTGFDGYFEKMAAQAAGNNLPDIMQQNFGEYVNLYASQDLLTDLSPFVEDGTIDLDGVSDTIVDAGKVGGTLVGIPTGTNALVATYDSAAFEDAGIDAPTHDWTWEDYERIAREYHEETGKYGARLNEPGNMFEYYLREKGYALFNEDGTGLGYDDDQLLVDYLSMTKGLIDDGVMPGYDVIQLIKGLEDELIVRGETPLDLTNWSNQVGALENAAGTPIEMVVLPGENNDRGMFLKPSMLWSIGKNSEHKEEAAKFINFFTNTVEVFEIIGSDRGVPIKPEVREALEPNLSDIDQKVYDYVNYVSENSSPADTNFPPSASEVFKALEDTDELVMYGELTPEEGAEQFRMNAERILAK